MKTICPYLDDERNSNQDDGKMKKSAGQIIIQPLSLLHNFFLDSHDSNIGILFLVSSLYKHDKFVLVNV